jgi:D-methionine transport system ATP-binding protein
MIELRDLNVVFHTKSRSIHAVRNVSLGIGNGESFGIVGASGAGKSTLLRTINLLQRPSSGAVLLDGKDITGLGAEELRAQRSKIGMVFQHFNLFMRKTVFENVAFPLRIAGASRPAIEARVPELLKIVGLEERARAYPARLSGGQKQRVGIARALANQPSILLCDEPTSALDIDTTNAILELLGEINQRLGLTIVLISHEMSVIKQACRRVAVMKDGEVVEQGDVYDIFARPEHPYTQQLVTGTFDLGLPDRVLADIQDPILRLTYRGDGAESPVLSEATRELGVAFNILHGRIEYIGGRPLGMLVVGVRSPAGTFPAVMQHLKDKGVELRVVRDEIRAAARAPGTQ